MVLLLMVATVSAKTEELPFKTDINVILTYNGTLCRYDIEAENNQWNDYVSSPTSTPRNKTYEIKIYRDVEIEELSNLENITKVMEELADVSLQLAKYGNDSKTFQEKYNEKNEAWARLVENYDDCKEDRDIYKNDSIQLGTCQSELVNTRTAKNQCNSDLSVCAKDLEDQKASTQTAWVVGAIIGGAIVFGFVEYKKRFEPSERGSFQH